MGMGGEMETAAEGRRILVAVDEGDESVHALQWCLSSFAARGGGGGADTIILLYVRPSPPTYSVLDASGTYMSLSPPLCARSTLFWRRELIGPPVP